MTWMVLAVCGLCMLAAFCQWQRGKAAPFLWMLTSAMCVFLLYWHDKTILSFRENTLQTLVWSVSAILSGCMGLCSRLDMDHSEVFRERGQHPLMTRYLYIAVLVVTLCLLGIIPETKDINSFMRTFPASKFFFWSRPVSAGFCLFGAAGFLSIFTLKSGGIRARRVFCQSRDAAMLGGIAFIGGEISGSYWSLCGWGSTWRWSNNFFGSASVFLLLMVGMHLPNTLFGRRIPRSLLSGVIYFIAGTSIVLEKLG